MNKTKLEECIEKRMSTYDIAKLFNKGQTTVRYWLKKYNLKTTNYNKGNHKRKYPKIKYTDWNTEQQKAYSYILGFYLGDGCASKYTFMITNHKDFSNMNEYIMQQISLISEDSKPKYTKRKNSKAIDIKICSLSFCELFPKGKGVKFKRKIKLDPWQKNIIDSHPKEFIKGLFESDGCRYKPTKHFKYYCFSFINKSTDIQNLLREQLKNLGYIFTTHIKTKHNIHITTLYRKEYCVLLDELIDKS